MPKIVQPEIDMEHAVTLIAQMLMNDVEYQDPVKKNTLIAEADGGNEWAAAIINLIVDRGRLLALFNSCHALLAFLWETFALLDEDGVRNFGENDTLEALYWHLAAMDSLNPDNSISRRTLDEFLKPVFKTETIEEVKDGIDGEPEVLR